MTASISIQDLSTGYGDITISAGLDLSIPSNNFTVIIGPNACGKSTLLRSIARVQKVQGGEILLDGKEIYQWKSKELARKLGLLPQFNVVPEKMSVRDLVARGRSPHQGVFRQWSQLDQDAVQRALERTGLASLADSDVDELSGGQRQRAWLALVLAQDTEVVLLDEPTTFLDLAHQIEILELCQQMYQQNRTVVAVLHDLNLAARYATYLVVMQEGKVIASGPPKRVITEQLMEDVFELPSAIIPDPLTGAPLIIPRPGLHRNTLAP
ncbi:MAG: ABC transporter ATP-binding protein [Corynebacterium sp.]|nr:ABC transporter ATP-binding protein [Corynebacterium sp.]